jgi:hypothetical protein
LAPSRKPGLTWTPDGSVRFGEIRNVRKAA